MYHITELFLVGMDSDQQVYLCYHNKIASFLGEKILFSYLDRKVFCSRTHLAQPESPSKLWLVTMSMIILNDIEI